MLGGWIIDKISLTIIDLKYEEEEEPQRGETWKALFL